MKVYGKIIKTYPNERIIKVLGARKMYYLYMSRKLFRDFGPYFFHKPYIFVDISKEKKRHGSFVCYEINYFNKIVQSSKRKKKIYYDLDIIRKGVKNLLVRPTYKMFLDLEFSFPPYYQTMKHEAEIIQYGFIVEDTNGDVIFEDSSLVKPRKRYAINQRTLKFIGRKREDFDYACTYLEFYKILKWCIKRYDVKIIAWGRNDILALESSFKMNKLMGLTIRERYINLMQVIKNYYNIKNDLGLFKTYRRLSGVEIKKQKHDALEDALIVREIYRIFKDNVIKEVV